MEIKLKHIKVDEMFWRIKVSYLRFSEEVCVKRFKAISTLPCQASNLAILLPWMTKLEGPMAWFPPCKVNKWVFSLSWCQYALKSFNNLIFFPFIWILNPKTLKRKKKEKCMIKTKFIPWFKNTFRTSTFNFRGSSTLTYCCLFLW